MGKRLICEKPIEETILVLLLNRGGKSCIFSGVGEIRNRGKPPRSSRIEIWVFARCGIGGKEIACAPPRGEGERRGGGEDFFYFSDVGTGRVMIPAKSTCCKGGRREEEFLNPGGPQEEETGVLDCNASS